jgi:DNA polymerase III alpha subunit (gram-positive type)
MKYTIFDIETNGLLKEVTLIHCLYYAIIDNGKLVSKGVMTNYNEMVSFMLNQEILCGHNIIRYDIPVLNKILNITITATLIDSLALSWYLYPQRIKHGLESWGEELGTKKPIILDWSNLTREEYINRCKSDVEIRILTINL